MAEVLRELVVQLSLDADNYTRNMKSIASQVKQAEATFKNAGAGIKNFEKTLEGMKAKSSSLTQTLQLQSLAVEQAAKRQAEANKKLAEAKGYYDDYSNRLKQAKANVAAFARAGETAESGLKRQKQIIESCNKQLLKYDEARQNGIKLSDDEIANEKRLIEMREQAGQALEKYAASTAEGIKLLEGQVASERKMLQNAQDEAAKAGTVFQTQQAKYKEMLAEQERLTREIATQSSAWWKAGEAMETFSKKAEKASKAAVYIGKTLSAAVTAPVVALGKQALDASTSYESAFANVRKTVDATEKEYGELSDSILKMSTTIGASAEEIATVMATAGQLGIHNEDLVDFTRTMIDLSNAAEDLDADAAATQAAKFANIMQMDQSMFSNLGAAITDLGNNFATTEGAILEMAMRMAGAGKQVGLSEAQVLGFATALSSVGIEAQMGGSALSKALVKMEVAVETGSDELADFAKVAGMTEKEFASMWRSSAADAFQAFILGLAQLDEKGESTIKVLSDIGINELRLRDTLLRTTNASELMTRAQTTANRAWKQNTALTNEVNKRYGTTEYKLKNLKNSATNLLRTVGDDLNPTVQSLIGSAQGFLENLANMDEGSRRAIERFAGIAAAAGPVALTFGKLSEIAGKAAKPLGTLFKDFAKFNGILKTTDGSIIEKLGAAFDKVPTGLKVAGIAAATIAVIEGTNALIDYATGAKQAREEIEQMNNVAQGWANNHADTFYNNGGMANLGLTLDDFKAKYRDMSKWMTDFLLDWNDGQKETVESVKQWQDSFGEINADIRAGLNARRDEAKKYGAKDLVNQIDADFTELKAIQRRVNSLISASKKRDLTKGEMENLQKYIDRQKEIEVYYKLVPADEGSGYEAIRKAVEAEERRREQLGYKGASADFYQSAIVAAMEARKALSDQIDQEYDEEYEALERLISVAKEGSAEQLRLKEQLEQLNERYKTRRHENDVKYAESIGQVFEGVTKQDSWINWIGSDGKGGWLEKLNAAVGGQGELAKVVSEIAGEEGSLTEVVSLLSQLVEIRGIMGDADFASVFGADFDPQAIIDKFAGITASLEGTAVYDMFKKAVPDEVIELAKNFGFDNIATAWEEFKAGNDFSIDIKVNSFDTKETKIEEQRIDAYIENLKAKDSGEGATNANGVKAWLKTNPLTGYVEKVYPSKDGVDASAVQADAGLAGFAAVVAKFFTDPEHPADISEITAPNVEAVATKIVKDAGGLFDISAAGLKPAVTAVVAQLTQDPTVDMYGLSNDEKLWVYAYLKEFDLTLAQAYANANKLDLSANPIPEITLSDTTIHDLTAEVTEVDASKAAPVKIKGLLTSYDMDAITAYQSQGHAFTGQTTVMRSNTTLQKLIAGGAIVIDANGEEVKVDADSVESVVGGKDAVIGQNEKLQWVIVANSVAEATEEAVEKAAETITQSGKIQKWNRDYGHFGLDTSSMGWFGAALENADRFLQTHFALNRVPDLNEGEQHDLAKSIGVIANSLKDGKTVNQKTADAFNDAVNVLLTSTAVDNANGMDARPNQTARNETVANLRSAGYDVGDESLDPFLENLVKDAYEAAGVVAEEKAKAIAQKEAELLADSIRKEDLLTMALLALKDAGYSPTSLGIDFSDTDTWIKMADEYAPGWRDAGKANGEDYEEGATEAIEGADLSTPIEIMVKETGAETLPSFTALGDASGDGMVDAIIGTIDTRTPEVVNAVGRLVAAVKESQEIHSPSRLWKREVGYQMAAGIGPGFSKGIDEQIPVIRNAMNYLTNDAQRTASYVRGASYGDVSELLTKLLPAMQAYQNKTYNANSNLNVQNMYMQNEMDAQALAEEMAAMNRRIHKGYGAFAM